MTSPHSTGLERLAAPLLRALTAETIEDVLSESVQLVAALADAGLAAAFMIEGDCAVHEAWSPAGAAGIPDAQALRKLAVDTASADSRSETVPHAGPAGARIVPLRSHGRTFGALALILDNARQASPTLEAELDLAARLVAEAIEWHRRTTTLRVTADQQERWLRQLDHQVRVLDRERQKFAAVVNQSDTYVFVTDLNSRIRWANRTLTLRKPPGGGAEWLGRSCRDVCAAFGSDEPAESGCTAGCSNCPVARALASNESGHHEFHGNFGGQNRTLYVSALPIKGVDGRPQEVLVLMQDLTDLQILKESEERYRVVTQTASDGIVTVDEAGIIQFVNEAMQRIFGYAVSELVGQPLAKLMPAGFGDPLARYLKSGDRSGSWDGGQLPARHSSGREILIELSFGEYVKDGRRWFTAVMRDLTDRRRAEAALERAQEEQRLVVATAPIVLFALDRNGIFTLSEGRGLAALGLKPGEAIGKSAFEMYAPFPAILENLRRALAGEEFRDVVDVGEFAFETSYTPLRDGTGAVTGLIGVANDVTERRRLEEQLRQSQKMEAVGRLAGGVAHDFNNLLTTILGYTTLLLQRHASGDEPDRRLVEIRRAAERAAGLTRQLLAFSRRQVVEPRVVDVNSVVAGVEEMLRRLIGEDVDFVFTPAPSAAPVMADPGQLEQVLMNLVVNARDAMPRGGQLTVEVAHADLRQPLTQGDVTLLAGPCVSLLVRDTGCGMAPETQAHIFEPFFTSKAFGQGTGLGLAIVYGIVQQNGGHIEVQSTPNVGSQFTIYLPLAAGTHAAGTDREIGRAGSGTETLLLVEDEAPVRVLAHEMLVQQGYTVLQASNGPEALAVAGRDHVPIDLLITDVVMPGMSGGELVERLLETNPKLRVLYISGYSDDAIVRHGVKHADSAFLQKPFTYEAFVAKVREVLDRGPGTAERNAA